MQKHYLIETPSTIRIFDKTDGNKPKNLTLFTYKKLIL